MKDFVFDSIENRSGLVAIFSHATEYRWEHPTLDGEAIPVPHSASAFDLPSLETRIRNMEARGADTSEERRGLLALLFALANQSEARGDDQRWSELQDRIAEAKETALLTADIKERKDHQ